jgi:hypothetical protein
VIGMVHGDLLDDVLTQTMADGAQDWAATGAVDCDLVSGDDRG